MSRGVFIKIIPVLGSIVLFLAWVFQQTLLNDVNSTLQRISTAQAVFQTYQSNNAIFSALVAVAQTDPEAVEQVRRLQIYNYELGLRDLEALLDDTARSDIPAAPNPYSGTPDVAVMMDILQERINTIQGHLFDKRDQLANRKANLNALFLVLYALGSVTVLVGSILNAMASAPAREAQDRTGKE